MLSRFWKNKDDGSSKSGPPGHRPGQPSGPDAAGASAPPAEPVGGGFFNLPPTVAKGHAPAYGAPAPGAPSAGAGGAAPSQYGRPASASGGSYSVPSYGAPQPPQPPQYGQPQPPSYGNHAAAPPAAGGMDMFGGMSLKAPAAAPAGYGGGPQSLKPSPVKYGGYGAPHHDSAPNSSAAPPSGALFSGLDLAPGGATAAPSPAPYGHDDEIVRPGVERRKSGGSVRGGKFNYMDVAATSGAADAAPVQRQSIGPGVGSISRPGVAKNVKKKKTKSFRPGFGRQLSDESIAALQRGDLNPEDVMQQHHTAEESAPAAQSRIATNATDLAHLLPPVKGGSVLAGLTVHDGGSSSATSGGSVLAGLTVHGGSSPRGSSKSSSAPSEGGLLAGLNVHRKTSVDEHSDASTSVVLPSSNERSASKKKSSPQEPEKPVAPPTPEEKLMNTLRDFHASAVSFRDSSLKQNEEENKILERKVQLAKQLTQYEIDLRTIEAQQQQAVEVEDFEKADALNSTINSVRHCITLSESDVRKVDSELVAFVKAKEKAFTNQLRSTRGTLKELEKFRDDQDAERSALREELKKYEHEQTEHLQFEAERIESELHNVSSNMDLLTSEKGEIEATIEEQCKSDISLREELLVEKAGVHEEIVELERQLQIKLEQMRGIQASIDKADKDIDAVRSRYSRQLKRIDDREEGLMKTKAEVEADAEQLTEEKKLFAETIHDYGVRISAFGKRMKVAKKEMRAAMLLATVLEVQETRREQATIRRKQQTAELTALADSAAIAEQSFMMLRKQHEELEKSLTVHHNAIASAQAMIPQLEQEKKAAAAQRNFKEAARISKDIKALEKDQSTAEEMVEVVEMELQDLKERIEKRETEYEEKKEELKTVEKQLELNTLHELWKEAKSLRRSLRKFEKVKSEGIAAADGIDFRSSALLLVQAEYDACVVQAEALEAKYGVTDPSVDEEEEEVEDEEDGDESSDEDLDEHVASAALLSSSVSATDGNTGTQIAVDGTHPAEGSATTLEEIAEKIAELEYLIEEATENEEYERAAKLDEQLQVLRQRESALEAIQSTTVDTIDNTGNTARNDDDGHPDDGHEEEGEEEGNSPEELEDELRLLRARIKMLEADIERDTENEDYDAAAKLQEELDHLREEESEIVDLLAESQRQATDQEVQIGSSSADGDNTAAEAPSLFAGLGMNNTATDAVVDSTNNMFAGLQVSASPEIVADAAVDEGTSESADIPASATSPKEPTASPRRLSVGSGPNSPRRKSSVSMFSGLMVGSGSMESPRKSSTASLSGEPASSEAPSMFEGLSVGSSGVLSEEPTVLTTETSVLDGLEGRSVQNEAATEVSSSDSIFGGMTVVSNNDEATNSDDGVIVDAEDTVSHPEASCEEVKVGESSILSGLSVKSSEATEDISARMEELAQSTSEAASSPLDMFGGLSLAQVPVTPDAPTESELDVGAVADVATTPLDMFGGLSLAPTADVPVTGSSAVADAEVPTSPVDMFGGLSLAPAPGAVSDAKPSEE